jgi:hypothetical protein
MFPSDKTTFPVGPETGPKSNFTPSALKALLVGFPSGVQAYGTSRWTTDRSSKVTTPDATDVGAFPGANVITLPSKSQSPSHLRSPA